MNSDSKGSYAPYEEPLTDGERLLENMDSGLYYTSTELARIAGIQRGSVSSLLSRLANRGLVRAEKPDKGRGYVWIRNEVPTNGRTGISRERKNSKHPDPIETLEESLLDIEHSLTKAMLALSELRERIEVLGKIKEII